MIVRAPRPEGHFYVLDKSISEDRRLSWAGRGLLIYLLGKPDHWRIMPAALVAETAGSTKSTGRDGIYSLLSELIGAGYIVREQARAADGAMGPVSYNVSERPHPDSPETVEPHPVEPRPANPPLASIDTKQPLKIQQSLAVTFDGEALRVTDEAMSAFASAHPTIDVRAEVAKASVWCRHNPAKRPRSAYGRFLASWLARASSRPTNARMTQLEQRQQFMQSIFRNHGAPDANADANTIDHVP